VHDLEAKSRRRDILVDEELLYAFYAVRVPEGIYSTPQFEQWLRQASVAQPKLLHLRLEDLLRQPLDTDPAQFPDHLDLDGLALPFEYRFEPGDEADGVTLVVPVEVLAQVSEGRASWLVPGLLLEKIVALIRTLPKALRKHFVPAPDVAAHCRQALRPGETPLVQALGLALSRRAGVLVPEDAWDEAALPDYLRMRFRVVDEEGATIEAGRDLAALRRRHAAAGATARRLPRAGIERAALKDFDVDPLPESVELVRGGVRLRGYPALVDRGDSVAVEALDSAERAFAAHRGGLRRLVALRLGRELRDLRRGLPGLERMRLQYAKAPRREGGGADVELADELTDLILDRAFLGDVPLPRDRSAFVACLAAGRVRVSAVAQEAGALAATILERYQAVRQALSGRIPPAWLPSVRDAQAQLDRLVWRGFLLATPWQRLVEVPRYLGALAKRLEKLQFGVTRDQQRMGEMAAVEVQWRERATQAEQAGRVDPRLDEIRWMLEELRVSLFAQELGTAYPISVQRIERRWRELGL
jgi:ATP-dependent helicase HrpA